MKPKKDGFQMNKIHAGYYTITLPLFPMDLINLRLENRTLVIEILSNATDCLTCKLEVKLLFIQNQIQKRILCKSTQSSV